MPDHGSPVETLAAVDSEAAQEPAASEAAASPSTLDCSSPQQPGIDFMNLHFGLNIRDTFFCIKVCTMFHLKSKAINLSDYFATIISYLSY
jgi:hypothetical protein